MTYFACQFKEENGYRLSTLKLIPEISIHILKPLQWRKTNIKPEEFEGINAKWSKKCKPQSNWTIERWMKCLNKCIKQYREEQQIRVITPSNVIQPIDQQVEFKNIQPINQASIIQINQPIPIKSVPVEIIKPISLEPIEAISKYRDGSIYDLVTDDSDPLKQITNTLETELKEFIVKRLNELQTEYKVTSNCNIDFNMELYFD